MNIMKFPGNCLIVSLIASALPGNRLRMKRNRMGRIHFYWQDKDGRSWEFYKRGASGRNYLQNSFYFGEIKRTD
jgi:hypothetical protein